MPGYTPLPTFLEQELDQSIEEGKDPAAAKALRDEIAAHVNDPERFEALHERFLSLPQRPDFHFVEPSDLESIHRLRPSSELDLRVDWNHDSLGDKMYGAWLGRCTGCALGKPLENYMSPHNGLTSQQRIKNYLTAISPDEWPIRDYVPQHSPAESQVGQSFCSASTREHIAFMETDDDIRYTVLGQLVLQKHGRDFTTFDVATMWLEKLSYRQVCTAETQAYRNLVMRYEFHERSKDFAKPDWHWVATHFNPYREWIGAQIRVDSYGYAAPGNPALAAEFAWRDARLSHVKNGIYGAMFCAAMIAASFATRDVRAIVEAGLGEIPATSRLYHDMRETLDICDQHHCDPAQFEQVLNAIVSLLGRYSPVHTNNNAALCVAALMLSGGDFAKGITLAVMGGWDTDCNGATVGSIVGAITGAKNAPEHWTKRLQDTLNSQIAGYHPIAISECARRSLEIARKVTGK